MPKPSWSGDVSRKIVRRVVVEGNLVLQTPAHLGNGDGNYLVDMPLLTDPLDEKTPLLTGASIAGALRGYLHEREHGFRTKVVSDAETTKSASVLLFGGNKGYDYGEQSPLIVEDARGKNNHIELRDGVGLAGDSHTAAKDKLFNVEMWEAGTTFPLRFELVVCLDDNASALKQALATALDGFNNDSITIGARKRRGYGQVRVTDWRIKEYILTDTTHLLDWLENGAKELSGTTDSNIVQAIGVSEPLQDHRQAFRLAAEFLLNGSLVIRSGRGPDEGVMNEADVEFPDLVHLHSARPMSDGTRPRLPILSGTSLAGALRARALKITRLLAADAKGDEKTPSELIDSMFGTNMDIAEKLVANMNTNKKLAASRVTVYEHVVDGITEKEDTSVQNRVSIDRFTGGTRDGALFTEQPLLGGEQSVVKVELQLANPKEYEIGLLLLLLKDLWTGDLPLGGEISVGRGRLSGKSCKLMYQNGKMQTWQLLANGTNSLVVEQGEPKDLEDYVAKLGTHLSGSKS